MNRRRAFTALAAAAVPLALATAPAQAAPPAGKGKPPKPIITEDVTGTLAFINTKARKIVLDDGRLLKYDSNDILYPQHYHDVAVDWDEDGVDCDLRDFGGEEEIARFVINGLSAQVDVTTSKDRAYVQIFRVLANTCDGVLDSADVF